MRVSPLLLVAAAAGCTDYSFTGDKGIEGDGALALELRPPRVEFAAAGAGEEQVQELLLVNVGPSEALLGTWSFAVEADDGGPAPADFTLLDPLPPSLDPGAQVPLRVAFAPTRGGARAARARAWPPDGGHPDLVSTLVGEGLLPALRLSPAAQDLGELPLGCGADAALRLESIGEVPVTVTALELDPAAGWTELPALPLTLGPGEGRALGLRWTPAAAGAQQIGVVARSDDPDGDDAATLQVEATEGPLREESFSVGEDAALDLILAVDQSCSMDDDAAALALNFDRFVDGLQASAVDWQLAVVTLDAACANGGLLGPGDPGLDAAFAAAVQLGEDREVSDDEALLKMAAGAAGQAGAGGCNEGLLRPSGLLHVIVISDEPERSHEQAAGWTWDHWVRALEADAGAGGLLISGVVDADGCNEGDAGYAEAIAATGGLHLSICGADWGAAADALAATSVAGVWTFSLGGDPDVTTITVEVDGAPTAAWTWDPATGALTVEPVPGASGVTVRYREQVACP
jgi:hypothetical protein